MLHCRRDNAEYTHFGLKTFLVNVITFYFLDALYLKEFNKKML
jgi:hypothetical protein